MSIESVQTNQSLFTQDQVDLIKRTICEGATDDELSLFVQICKKTRLDPFSKQIYAVKRKAKDKSGQYIEKMSYQVSIDGLRLTADRTGKYQGQSSPMWCGEDGKWVDVWLKTTPPLASKVSVFRNDFKEPTTGVATFDSYAQKYQGVATSLWKSMPDVMLAKCAEALALRKAFPNELSGIYAEEEMGQLDNIQADKARSEIQVKDVQLDQESTIEMHKELIATAINIDSLSKCYRSAIGFAKSIGSRELAESFAQIKDSAKAALAANSHETVEAN